jgi:hypothetical protein
MDSRFCLKKKPNLEGKSHSFTEGYDTWGSYRPDILPLVGMGEEKGLK